MCRYSLYQIGRGAAIVRGHPRLIGARLVVLAIVLVIAQPSIVCAPVRLDRLLQKIGNLLLDSRHLFLAIRRNRPSSS
jgi:hypothetical protein